MAPLGFAPYTDPQMMLLRGRLATGIMGICVGLTMASGCRYTSHYVPPDDSRVRPVWIGKSIVPVGASRLPGCSKMPEVEMLWSYAPLPTATQDTSSSGMTVVFVDDAETRWSSSDDADDDDDDGGDKAKAAAALAALTFVVASSIAVGSIAAATVPAGDRRKNAVVLDEINSYNSQLRHRQRCLAKRDEEREREAMQAQGLAPARTSQWHDDAFEQGAPR